MTFNSLLKMKDFYSRINLLEKKVKNFLVDHPYEIDSKKIEEFVQWNHTIKDEEVVRMIYPNEHCTNDLKKIVKNFIQKEFNNIK